MIEVALRTEDSYGEEWSNKQGAGSSEAVHKNNNEDIRTSEGCAQGVASSVQA